MQWYYNIQENRFCSDSVALQIITRTSPYRVFFSMAQTEFLHEHAWFKCHLRLLYAFMMFMRFYCQEKHGYKTTTLHTNRKCYCTIDTGSCLQWVWFWAPSYNQCRFLCIRFIDCNVERFITMSTRVYNEWFFLHLFTHCKWDLV